MPLTANAHPGKVVVITGASSGIGKATALLLAARGCRLALAARRTDALEETATACRAQGGQAVVVTTDVTKELDVQALAAAAIDAYGTIDVWVNNAGVTLFALLSEGTADEHKRVFETNVYGAMHGARAIIPYFKERGRGILVNVGSLLSKVGQPFVPSYTMSKFAVRGMSEALRAEVAEHPDVHVCTIFPFAVNTPHFEEGANERGVKARAMPPAQDPRDVAEAIVGLIDRPRAEVHVPKVAVLGVALHRMFPRTTERLLLRALRRWHFDDSPEPHTEGNLRAGGNNASVEGTRPPRLSTAAFLAWVAADFVRMEVESIMRAVRRLGGGGVDDRAC